jgi:hypothetical protein
MTARKNLFIEWYERLHREKLENPDEAPLIVEYLSKQPKTMASLALLFHLVDRAEAIAAGEIAGPVSLRRCRACCRLVQLPRSARSPHLRTGRQPAITGRRCTGRTHRQRSA